MWQERPSSAAAMASMRPSWPPPRMPTIMPGASGRSFIAGTFVHAGRLVHAPAVEFGRDLVVGKREDGGGEERGVDRPGAADGERADRNSCRHLDDGIKAVLAA